MTQLKQIKNHLLEHGKITSWGAITKYRITRLSEMIRQLREQGLDITMTRINTDKNWYGLYKLEK